LDSIDIEYEKQKQIGRTRPDAYIPELNLCVYVDGLYWHSRQKDLDRDSRANNFLTKKEYYYIRLISNREGNNIDLSQLEQILHYRI